MLQPPYAISRPHDCPPFITTYFGKKTESLDIVSALLEESSVPEPAGTAPYNGAEALPIPMLKATVRQIESGSRNVSHLNSFCVLSLQLIFASSFRR